jgi:hypothetical protein
MRPDCRDLARPATYDKTKKIYFETENAAKATWGIQIADKISSQFAEFARPIAKQTMRS